MFRFGVLLSLLYLTACATSSVDMVKNYSEGTELGSDKGIVVARIVNASAYDWSFNYLTLAPKDFHADSDIKLQRLTKFSDMPKLQTLFAAPVNAGKYSIADLFSYHQVGDYYYQNWANTSPNFGTFTVEAGKVTNLGTLVYYHKPDGDRYHKLVARADDAEQALDEARRAVPDLFNLADSETLTWDEDEYEEERFDLFLNIAQNPIVYNKQVNRLDGSYVYLSKLGMMLRRDNDGNWLLDSVDTFHDLIHYSENNRGDEVLVDAGSNIFIKYGGSSEWQKGRIDCNFEQLEYIHLGNDGNVYAVLSFERQLEISMLEDFDNGALQVLKKYSKKLGGWLSEKEFDAKHDELLAEHTDLRIDTEKLLPKVRRVSTARKEDQAVLTVDKRFYLISFNESRVDEVESSFKPGTILRATNDAWLASSAAIFGSNFVSFNKGESWEKYSNQVRIDACPGENQEDAASRSDRRGARCLDGKVKFNQMNFVGLPLFYEDGTGYAILADTIRDIWKGTSETNFYFVSTDDRGETWENKNTDIPDHCVNLSKPPNSNDLLLGCANTTGRFYRSDRHDLNWILEFSPESF